jgi:2TM domain-containing protein
MDDAREAARRWVRRKRRFYTILVVYLALSVLWFAIDMLTGTDDLWFYWPVLGAGLIVAVIGVAMFGVAGLFGGDWEQRQVDQYLQRRDPGEQGGTAQPGRRPPTG